MKLLISMLLFSTSALALNCPFIEQNNQYSKTIAVCQNIETGTTACLAEYTNSGNFKVEVEDKNQDGIYSISFSDKTIQQNNSKKIKLKDKQFGLGFLGYRNIQFELDKKKQSAKFQFKTRGCGFSMMNSAPDPRCLDNIKVKFEECSL